MAGTLRKDFLRKKKLLFFWILSKLPPPLSPQFGHFVQLFSDVKIQDLTVSLGLKILTKNTPLKNVSKVWQGVFFSGERPIMFPS